MRYFLFNPEELANERKIWHRLIGSRLNNPDAEYEIAEGLANIAKQAVSKKQTCCEITDFMNEEHSDLTFRQVMMERVFEFVAGTDAETYLKAKKI